MVQRLICCLSCLSLSVAVAIGSDRPSDIAPPAPPLATPRLSVDAPAPLSLVDASLSPVDHLRRAADHLEAAAIGELAKELKTEATELREMADEVENEVQVKLAELRNQLAAVQKEIRQWERLTGSIEQVQLDIKVVEIDMSAAKQLKLDTDLLNADLLRLFVQQPEAQVSQAAFTVGSPATFAVVNPQEMTALIDTLVAKGAAKILSEPCLVTFSGREASIRSGGEFPILIPKGQDTVEIEWRELGMRTTAMPVVLDDGSLRLEFIYQFDELDFQNTVTVAGTPTPGIKCRRVNAQVEMQFGQTALIGGLTSTENVADRKEQSPILNKLPHTRLFKQVSGSSEARVKQLVVLVTPSRLDAK